MFTISNLVTQIGDLAVLLPLAIATAILLYISKNRQAAMYFAVIFTSCLATMGLLKFFFLSCGGRFRIGIESPSGHAAASTMVLGSICLIACFQVSGFVRMLIAAVTVSLIAAIAVSRVVLGAHSVNEVIAGTVTGMFFLALFAAAYARVPQKPLRLTLLAGGIPLMLVALYGSHLPIEVWLRRSVALISNNNHTCF